GFGDGEETLRTQGAALSWTHTFSRTLINEARVGFGREHNVRLQAFGNDTSDIPGKYGIPGIVQTPGNGGLPFFGIGSLAGLGSSNWLGRITAPRPTLCQVLQAPEPGSSFPLNARAPQSLPVLSAPWPRTVSSWSIRTSLAPAWGGPRRRTLRRASASPIRRPPSLSS